MTNGSKKKIWVSELIGEDYKRWKKEFIILDCGTGCGKTYFCLNVLGLYAKKSRKNILYLCNRSKLRSEIISKVRTLKLTGIVWVETYQSLQKKIQNKMNIPTYDYIVVDECHYFTTDALFNNYTDVSYNFIMNRKEATVIWTSATAKVFFNWLEKKNRVRKKNIYRIDKDYSYVDKLYFYQKEELTTIIDDILENQLKDKIVVFCNSAERISQMNKYYGTQANYYCSNSSASMKLKNICGYDKTTGKVKDCIRNDTFDKRILFTTTVLDNGVDLKDENIKHIFCEVFDVDCAIQALGRKRSLNKDDTCTFYIREFQPKAIQGFLNINNSQLEPVQLYKNDYDAFYKKYGNGKKRKLLSSNKIFYSYFSEDKYLSKIKVNECKFRKYEQDNTILSWMKELGYISVINHYLGEELASKSEYIVVDVKQIDIFLEHLKSLEGKWLFKSDRELIKEEFETVGVKLRYIGINTFNGALEDLYKELYQCRFYNQTLDNKPLIDKRRKLEDGNINPNRDKRYWILEQR